jgi:O-6-methylguanine DNA methyltransferase
MKTEPTPFHITEISSPLGTMAAAANSRGVYLLEFIENNSAKKLLLDIDKRINLSDTEQENPHLILLKNELDAYFKGALKKFTVPLDLQGSDFQKKVWMELLTIPYGETRSYEQQTLKLGDLKAIRAVASANGKNRIAIVVPCHRVIGKNGSLTGYAGGLDKKLWLLDFESKYSGKSFQTSLEF